MPLRENLHSAPQSGKSTPVTKDPLFLIGVVLWIAALVGGGVKLAGNEIPVLKTFPRQALAAIAGTVLIGVAYDQNNFRAEEINFRPLGNYSGPCPGTHRVEGRIRAAGGEGEVRYRIFGHGYISNEGRMAFQEPSTIGFEASVPVWAPGQYTMTARITTPNDLDSAPIQYVAACTGAATSPSAPAPSAPAPAQEGPSPVQQQPLP
jgi:hypothetical protein